MRMFTRLRNSNVGYYLYTGLVIAAGAASLVFFYFMVTGFNIGVYEENTLIGSIYVGGLSEEEAEEKVREQVDAWLDDEEVTFEVGYQGYYYTLDRDMMDFEISETMDNVSDGSSNELIVRYSEDARDQITFEINQTQDFMEGLEGEFDLDAMLDDVLLDAAELKEWSRHELSDYIIDEAQLREVVHETILPTPPGVDAAAVFEGIAASLDDETSFTVESDGTLSVIDTFGGELNSSQLNVVGSLLQDLIAPTCMQIVESHYNPSINFDHFTVDDYPYYGRNVRVSPHIDNDFSFQNTCRLPYDFEFFLEGGTLGARIEGLPYLNSVSVEETRIRIPHGTITVDDPDDARGGHDGKIVILTRTVEDIYGAVVDEQEIVFEYYPPVEEAVYPD